MRLLILCQDINIYATTAANPTTSVWCIKCDGSVYHYCIGSHMPATTTARWAHTLVMCTVSTGCRTRTRPIWPRRPSSSSTPLSRRRPTPPKCASTDSRCHQILSPCDLSSSLLLLLQNISVNFVADFFGAAPLSAVHAAQIPDPNVRYIVLLHIYV
jgi:hypothetical protein